MCRVRNTHTSSPWTTAYICITIDDSCLDEEGNYIDKPMTVRMVQWQPYCVKKPFGPKTPVCAACKRTNRTRYFCRERHKHRHLPWCTVYVLLSSLDAADPSTIVAGPSKPLEVSEEKASTETASTSGKGSDEDDEGANKDEDDSDTITSDPEKKGDDINNIPESRTFLAKVSCRASSVHWLELADYDSSEAAPFPGTTSDASQFQGLLGNMDSQPQAVYYSQLGYAAQQHQSALKSRQELYFQLHQQHKKSSTQQNLVQQQQQQAQQLWQMNGYPQQQLQGTVPAPTPDLAAVAGQSHTLAGPSDELHVQQWAYFPPGQQTIYQTASQDGQSDFHPTHDNDIEEPDMKRHRVV